MSRGTVTGLGLWNRLFRVRGPKAKRFVWKPALKRSAKTSVALMSFQPH